MSRVLLSPDGAYIAFEQLSRSFPPKIEVILIDVVSGKGEAVISLREACSIGAWSPSGQHLLLGCHNMDGTEAGLFEYDLTEEDARAIYAFDDEDIVGSQPIYEEGGAGIFFMGYRLSDGTDNVWYYDGLKEEIRQVTFDGHPKGYLVSCEN